MGLRIPRSHPHQQPPKRILANSQEERDLNWRLSLMGLPPIQGEELAMVDLTPAIPIRQPPKPMTITEADREQINSVKAQYASMHRQGAALFKPAD